MIHISIFTILRSEFGKSIAAQNSARRPITGKNKMPQSIKAFGGISISLNMHKQVCEIRKVKDAYPNQKENFSKVLRNFDFFSSIEFLMGK